MTESDIQLTLVHHDQNLVTSPRQVPLAMALYQELRGPLGSHGGLAVATAMSTAGEVALTGWSERFGVHMGTLAELGSRSCEKSCEKLKMAIFWECTL